MSPQPEFLDHALRYAAAGWRVLPLHGKDAFTPDGVLDATNDPARIRNWWQIHPTDNIGFALGTDYWALDVDLRTGGEESLDSLILKHGRLPDTLQQQTGSGGRHFIFKRPPDINLRQSRSMIAPGLDVKTGNGYIVVAPSIHPETKRPYFWDGLAEFEEQPILPAPDWLLALALNNGQPVTAKVIAEKIKKGVQHGTLVSFAGTMRQRGAEEEEIFAALEVMNRIRCEEPGPVENIRQIARSAMQWQPGTRNVHIGKIYANGRAPAPQPDAEGDPAPEADAIEQAEAILAGVIASKDPLQIYDGPLIEAIAAAGDLKRHEAKRRLKAEFKSTFVVKEWDALIEAAIAKIFERKVEWSPFILSSDGNTIVACVANAITMMENLALEFNSFSQRVFLTKATPWGTIGNWTDYDDVKAAEWCQRAGLKIDKNTAADASDAVARNRKPHYHPVVEYLRSLKWDGVPRLDTWLTTYLGAPDNPYTRGVASKWMISAVKRPSEPGCQADYTLVLEGDQGKRKSTALRTLAGDPWFSDDVTDIGSKDCAMQLQGKWINEIPELDAVRRAEMTAVKAWLVRRVDHFRPPYGRRSDDFPRQNVFAATTNKYDWGNDDTGLRRFWPVRCGAIDIEGLAAVRDQLWAEAFFRYNEGEKSYLSDPMEALAGEEQKDRQEADVWTDEVTKWIKKPLHYSGSKTGPSDLLLHSTASHILLPEIMWHCLGIDRKDWKNWDKMRVSRILSLAKYVKKRESTGDRKEYWEPKGASTA